MDSEERINKEQHRAEETRSALDVLAFSTLVLLG
jgi:hypothetical protein